MSSAKPLSFYSQLIDAATNLLKGDAQFGESLDMPLHYSDIGCRQPRAWHRRAHCPALEHASTVDVVAQDGLQPDALMDGMLVKDHQQRGGHYAHYELAVQLPHHLQGEETQVNTFEKVTATQAKTE